MEVRFKLTKYRVAVAALFVLAGVGLGNLLSPLVGTALANVGQVVNISDHSGSAFFAEVDSAGKLAVGDGAGPLSVDGTVASRPAAPASPWSAMANIDGGANGFIAGPSASPINITSMSFSTETSGSGLYVMVSGFRLPSSATTCSGAVIDRQIWFIRDLGDGVTPVSFEFPTPLQYKPLANMKGCVAAQLLTATSSFTTINAVGFYGG